MTEPKTQSLLPHLYELRRELQTVAAQPEADPFIELFPIGSDCEIGVTPIRLGCLLEQAGLLLSMTATARAIEPEYPGPLGLWEALLRHFFFDDYLPNSEQHLVLPDASQRSLFCVDVLISQELWSAQQRWKTGYLGLLVTSEGVQRDGQIVLFRGKARLRAQPLKLVRALWQAGKQGLTRAQLLDAIYPNEVPNPNALDKLKSDANELLRKVGVTITAAGHWYLSLLS